MVGFFISFFVIGGDFYVIGNLGVVYCFFEVGDFWEVVECFFFLCMFV